MVEIVAATKYTAAQMFALVNDVASYHEFVPGCSKSVVLDSSLNQMIAELTIAQQVFATKNSLEHPRKITLNKLYGPFSKLQGVWEFEDTQDGCTVSLSLDYEFNSKMISYTLSPIFNKLAQTMLDAFVNRARVVYGAG